MGEIMNMYLNIWSIKT